MLGRPPDVVAHEQIEETIAVEVEPQRRRAESRPAAEAARLGDVHKRSLAGVAEQPVLPDTAHEQIGEAVVVPVADGDAHPVELDVEAGGPRHVGKRAVAVVAIEAQGRALPFVPWPVHAIHEQDILPAVRVVIEKRATGAHGFGQKLAAEGAAVVAKLQARGGRHIRQT